MNEPETLGLPAKYTIFWAVAQSWGGRLIVFVLFLFLARILAPAEFGLASASAVVLLLITQVAELGFGDALVQRKTLETKDVNLPFYVSLILSFLLTAIVWFNAESVEALFKVDRLASVLKVACFAAPLTTISLFQEAIYRRNLAFKSLALRVFVANGISGVIAISAAMLGLGVWSFIIQAYLSILLSIYWLWRNAIWSPSCQLDFPSFFKLGQFGLSVVATRLLDFGATRVIDLIIVARFGVVALGLYAVGSRIYLTLMQLLQGALSDVALSLLSKLADDRNGLRNLYLRTSALSAIIAAPAFTLCAIVSPEIFGIILGPKWDGADKIAQPLLLLGSIQCVQFINSVYLSAMGRPSISLVLNSLKICAVLISFYIFSGSDLETMIFWFACAQLITTPFSFLYISRALRLNAWTLSKNILPIYGSAAFAAFAVQQSRKMVASNLDSLLGRGLIFSILFLMIYVFALIVVARPQLRSSLQFLARKFNK